MVIGAIHVDIIQVNTSQLKKRSKTFRFSYMLFKLKSILHFGAMVHFCPLILLPNPFYQSCLQEEEEDRRKYALVNFISVSGKAIQQTDLRVIMDSSWTKWEVQARVVYSQADWKLAELTALWSGAQSPGGGKRPAVYCYRLQSCLTSSLITFPLDWHTEHPEKLFRWYTWDEWLRDQMVVLVQRDPKRLENWAGLNLVKQNKLLHLQRDWTRQSPEDLSSLQNFVILRFF